jgi:hypothetical protein
MRYLHAVGLYERFLASGSYINDNTGEIIEQWTAHALPDGAWLIRVDRILQNILLEGWRSPQGIMERIDVFRLQTPTVRITYMRGETRETVDYTRKTAQTDPIHETVTVPANTILDLPCILGAGFTLSALGETLTPVLRLDLDTLELSHYEKIGNAQAWGIELDAHGIPLVHHMENHTIKIRDYVPHHLFNLTYNPLRDTRP